MESVEITEIKAMQEKLGVYMRAMGVESAGSSSNDSSFERAFQRMKNALIEFSHNPTDLSKANTLLNALDHYQTAFELCLSRMENTMERIEEFELSKVER